VATDGSSDLTFQIGKGQYYLAIKHRNHLGIMSASPLSMGYSAITSFDLSQTSFPTFGTNATTLMSGKKAMWTGDADGSGIVNAGDRSAAWNFRNAQGYLQTDCTLKGITNAGDRSITWNNRNLTSQIPD
jgi:hypothetical protein